jgi:Tol biopolymer transport system component
VLWANLTLLLVPSPAHAAFVGKNGWFAFSALSPKGSIQLWREGDSGLVNLTGTTRTPQIMDHDNFSPAWSPEQGAHLVFVSAARTGNGRGPGDIWMMSPWPHMDPGFITNLTDSPDSDDESPSWDFTGGHVVYSSARVVNGGNQAGDIWKTSWTGRHTENLTRGTVSDDGQPAWSPRQHVIAFASNRTDRAGHHAGKSYGIWLMHSGDGRGIRRLTSAGTSPNWKSDGTKIAFVRGGDIWVMNADGSGQHRLTHDTTAETNPVWAPDGTKIAFQVGPGTLPERGTSMGVMNADGTGRHPMLRLRQFVGQSGPNWKPDCSVKPHRENGTWVIGGTPGPDLICFEKGASVIYGRAGNDSIYAGGGDDVVYGGAGNDIILGGPGNDILRGDPGDDYLEGDDGNDKLFGGPGSDSLNGGPGTDVCVDDASPIDSFGRCETMHARQSPLGLELTAWRYSRTKTHGPSRTSNQNR